MVIIIKLSSSHVKTAAPFGGFAVLSLEAILTEALLLIELALLGDQTHVHFHGADAVLLRRCACASRHALLA